MTATNVEPEQTAYRHVVRDPSVRGGFAVVEGARIGVHDIVGFYRTEKRWNHYCSTASLTLRGRGFILVSLTTRIIEARLIF